MIEFFVGLMPRLNDIFTFYYSPTTQLLTGGYIKTTVNNYYGILQLRWDGVSLHGYWYASFMKKTDGYYECYPDFSAFAAKPLVATT